MTSIISELRGGTELLITETEARRVRYYIHKKEEPKVREDVTDYVKTLGVVQFIIEYDALLEEQFNEIGGPIDE